MGLKPIGLKIPYELWLRIQMTNPSRGTWRKIFEDGSEIYLGPEKSEEQLLEEIKGINSKLNILQKILSDFRAKKLEEELRLKREESSFEQLLNSCLNCCSEVNLEEREGFLVCDKCRSQVSLWNKFKAKVKIETKKHTEAQIKMIKALKMNNPLWDVD